MRTRHPAGKATQLLIAVTSAALPFASPDIANATESSRAVTITNLHPIGNLRPSSPGTQGIVRIYVNSGAWGTTSCRTDAADLSTEETVRAMRRCARRSP